MLEHKKILLGVCGGIAAYKSAYLVRELIKRGAEVKVIMTASASDFIHPLTLSTLSKHPVLTEFIKENGTEWNNHVELGLWADLLVIAPATANTIAKLANGLCDNLLTATYLSARCETMICPAMDLDMYKHPAVVANLEKLRQYGNHIIDAKEGELASGLVGQGRLAEPEEIVEAIEHHVKKKRDLEGKKVLITAGPTQESLDPVRYITNHSSGKMGYSIAQEMVSRGAKVTLVSGPVNIALQHSALEVIKVHSAVEMLEACQLHHKEADIIIFCAAVADYRPAAIADQKIKKKEDDMMLKLVKNPDIAATLGMEKQPGQFHLGFALETENGEANAQSKLKKKHLDAVVLNVLSQDGVGFGHNTNKISIIEENKIHKFELKSKKAVAQDIVDFICTKKHN